MGEKDRHILPHHMDHHRNNHHNGNMDHHHKNHHDKNMDHHHNNHHSRNMGHRHENDNHRKIHKSMDQSEVYEPGMPSRYNPRLPGTHPSDVIMRNEEDNGKIQQIMLPEYPCYHEDVVPEFRSEHSYYHDNYHSDHEMTSSRRSSHSHRPSRDDMFSAESSMYPGDVIRSHHGGHPRNGISNRSFTFDERSANSVGRSHQPYGRDFSSSRRSSFHVNRR